MEGIQTRSDIMTVLASEIQERVFSEKVIKSTYDCSCLWLFVAYQKSGVIVPVI